MLLCNIILLHVSYRSSLNQWVRSLDIADVVKRAYAMPLTNPSFPPGPYRFFDREYIIITYRTTREALEAVVPAPLEIDEPLVKYEFIRMPDSTGFGDYTESGQVIPVSLRGRKGNYTHCMFLNDYPPIAGGRELWGFCSSGAWFRRSSWPRGRRSGAAREWAAEA